MYKTSVMTDSFDTATMMAIEVKVMQGLAQSWEMVVQYICLFALVKKLYKDIQNHFKIVLFINFL